jgi:hypothetical protein
MMRKEIVGAFTAVFIICAPLAHAQQGTSVAGDTSDNRLLSQTEFKMLTDVRVGVIKAALQLTPEQESLWPVVEEAIRARAEMRYRRLAAVEERMGQWREVDPVQLYRKRADVLAERSAGLKKLADAWQPLYQSLTSDQKMRLRFVTVRAIEGLRMAAEDRRMEAYDEDDIDFSQ